MQEMILLDTDIGSDIDDAVCLAYLLAQPRCDLLGITTVTGDVVQRAMLASALCRAAAKEVPIYPGAADPLILPQRQTEVPQATALTRWEHATRFAEGEAVEFMRRTIRSHPGQVTLLGIGPLTNIALLFSIDPHIPALLKQLVLMCGRFTDRIPQAHNVEWNALLDPHAAEIVYRAPLAVHRSVGLDVTLQVRLPADEVRQRFSADLLLPVRDFADAWFSSFPELIFHDPLAAACIFDQDICCFSSGAVTIDLQDQPGFTRWQGQAQDARHKVALQVEPQRFFDEFFSVFEGEK